MNILVCCTCDKGGDGVCPVATHVALTKNGPILRLCLVEATRAEHAYAVWSAARLFAALTAAPSGAVARALARPVTVLELGAGTGALSLHLVATGAASYATATDRPHVQQRLARNIAANAPHDRACATALEWGDDPLPALLASVRAAGKPPQVIVGTDLVVSDYKVEALARTTAALALMSELLQVAMAPPPVVSTAAPLQPSPPTWPPPWRQQACRVLLLNQLREEGAQTAFERAATRLLCLRRGGGGSVLAAARAAGDDFVLYRMRVRRDVCAADVGLSHESLARCGLLSCAAAPRLFCSACCSGGVGVGSFRGVGEDSGDALVGSGGIACLSPPIFCALCGSGRPACVTPSSPKPLLLAQQQLPLTRPALAAQTNPLSASSRALFESGLSRVQLSAIL